jgi:hypothetical protein
MTGAFVPDTKIVELSDSALVDIHPIQPDDAPRLQVIYSQLSPFSAFFRLLTRWKTLSPERAEY